MAVTRTYRSRSPERVQVQIQIRITNELRDRLSAEADTPCRLGQLPSRTSAGGDAGEVGETEVGLTNTC